MNRISNHYIPKNRDNIFHQECQTLIILSRVCPEGITYLLEGMAYLLNDRFKLLQMVLFFHFRIFHRHHFT